LITPRAAALLPIDGIHQLTDDPPQLRCDAVQRAPLATLFRCPLTSASPIGESACEHYKLLVGLDLKFFPDPLPLRRDAFLSVTEFLCNLLVCHPACKSPQQLLLARA
jgi:hypothetical protein